MSIPTFSWLTTFKALQLAGATHVEIAYSGGGDSGGIDAVSAVGDGVGTSPKVQQLMKALDGNFQEWAGEALMPRHGWWNGAGGCGTITIDLATLEATVEHTDYSDDSVSAAPFTRALPAALAKAVKAATGAWPWLYGYYTSDVGWEMSYAQGSRGGDCVPASLVNALLVWAQDSLEKKCPVELGEEGANVDLEVDVETGRMTFDVSVYIKSEDHSTDVYELLDPFDAD